MAPYLRALLLILAIIMPLALVLAVFGAWTGAPPAVTGIAIGGAAGVIGVWALQRSSRAEC